MARSAEAGANHVGNASNYGSRHGIRGLAPAAEPWHRGGPCLGRRGLRRFRTAQGGQGKCPHGYKFSARKKACAKLSCGTGRVWSGDKQACIDGHSATLTDQDLYDEARALVDDGAFTNALDLLYRIKKQEQPRVLNYIGYSTRKAGDLDKGLEYYHRALALDPSYLLAREYLGEGYLQKGDVAKAREQLVEIAARCGDACEEYDKLEQAIVRFVTGERDPQSW
jgi:predicted Zn-dependent protease